MSLWTEVPLGDLLLAARPGFACGEHAADGVFQVRMNNITVDGHLDLTKKRRVPGTQRKLRDFLVLEGDVLFNATNSPDLVGKSAYFPGLAEPTVFSNHFLRLRPNAQRLHGRYLAAWLRLAFQRRVFEGLCRQWVNQATVGRDSLLNLRMPLPPLSEQQRIAAILDHADALRAKRLAALAELDALTQSIFLEMFGDPVGNPKGWPVVQLAEHLAIPLRNGLSPSKSGKVSAKVLTLSAITGDCFDEDSWKESTFQTTPPSEQSVDETDFLICRGNGNANLVGKGYFPSRTMPEVTFPDTMIAARISPGKVERRFLQLLWNSSLVRQQIQALARTTNGTFKVNQEMLEGVSLLGPPALLQREFSRRVGALDAVRAGHRASLAHQDALFSSLQHRAFRGEL